MTPPALLLIHGFPLDASVWRPFRPYLEPYFRLLTPDLSGFGKSSAAPAATLEETAAALAAYLTQEAPAGAFVVGHSMGGYIALTLARLHPQQMLGLGLLASHPAPDSPPQRAARYQTAEQVEAQGMAVLAESMPAKLSADPGHYQPLREVILRQRPASASAALRAMAARPDQTSALAAFPRALILIHGQADSAIPIERARAAHTARPDARLTELPGVGHMPFWEAPQETAQALLEFL